MGGGRDGVRKLELQLIGPITATVIEPDPVQPPDLPEGCRLATCRSAHDLQFFDPASDVGQLHRFTYSDFAATVKRLEDAPARDGRVEVSVLDLGVALLALERLQARAERLNQEAREREQQLIEAADVYYATKDRATRDRVVCELFEWRLPLKESGERGRHVEIDYLAVALDWSRLTYPTGNDGDELPMPRVGIERVRPGLPDPREYRVLQVLRIRRVPRWPCEARIAHSTSLRTGTAWRVRMPPRTRFARDSIWQPRRTSTRESTSNNCPFRTAAVNSRF